MGPGNVRDSITRAFRDIVHSQWVYLEAGQDNLLSEMEQSLDGNAASSHRGCLYIMNKLLLSCKLHALICCMRNHTLSLSDSV